MLALDLGVGQGLGQAEAGRLVGQGAVLAEPALDLAGGGREAGDVAAGGASASGPATSWSTQRFRAWVVIWA